MNGKNKERGDYSYHGSEYLHFGGVGNTQLSVYNYYAEKNNNVIAFIWIASMPRCLQRVSFRIYLHTDDISRLKQRLLS